MRYELWLGLRYLFTKRRERFISMIASLVFLGVAGPIANNWAEESKTGKPTNGVQLTLRPEQQRYVIGEPIVMIRELKNGGEQPIVLCKTTAWTHTEYTRLAPHRTEPRMVISDGPPGDECWGEVVTLPSGFSRADRLHFEAYEFGVLGEPGTWQIHRQESYGYRKEKKASRALWTGVLTSNLVTIELQARKNSTTTPPRTEVGAQSNSSP